MHWYPLKKLNRIGARYQDGERNRGLELGSVTCRSAQIRRGVSSDHRDVLNNDITQNLISHDLKIQLAKTF